MTQNLGFYLIINEKSSFHVLIFKSDNKYYVVPIELFRFKNLYEYIEYKYSMTGRFSPISIRNLLHTHTAQQEQQGPIHTVYIHK